MLRHIKAERCPLCGAPPILDEVSVDQNGQIRLHVNGQRWESRKFECYYVIEWSPNFSAEMARGGTMCRNNIPAAITEAIAKREALRSKVQLMVKSADVDEKYKKLMLNHLSHSWDANPNNNLSFKE